MNHPCFQTADWDRAVTLSERIASLMAIEDGNLNLEIDADLARQSIDRWRAQPPFDKDTYFARRLAAANISEAQFRRILGEPIEAVRDRRSHPPDWLIELERAFADETEFEPINMPDELKEIPTIDFLNLIEPIVQQGCARLQAGIQTLIATASDLPFDPNTIETLLFANLPQRLLSIVSRTLVLELNVARLQELLQGDTPELRFQSFTQRLRQRDVALGILQEYPVMARQAALCINHWVTTSLEFLQHLCRDWDELRSQFCPSHQPGVLVEVSAGQGDSHREGRSVIVAKFSADLRVVYKPRSLSLDVHFQELLHWINERGNHPPLRLLKILDRQDYGWVEFIEAQPCSSADQIQRFYERQGAYLAILYALEAIDFHHENLIAAGECPILIDLEALFHPRIGGIDLDRASQLAIGTLNHSVYGTGLLPQRIWSNDESEGIDISGLGAPSGQLTPHQIPRWEGMGTDEMKLIRQQMEMPETQNQPTLNGEKVNVLDYTEAIANGFTNLYHMLLQHRDELLAPSGPIASFAEDTVRVIVRATRTYAILLNESFHPDVLRNALDRDRLLDRLWLAVENLPYLARLIAFEREDLLDGDIPMFTTRPDSQHLWTSSGRISNFLDKPGLASVRDRVQLMGEADLARQLWIIRASLTALYPIADEPEHKGHSGYPLTESPPIANRDRLLAAARSVGDRLEALALRGESDVTWIGLALVNDRHWTLTPLGYDLYDGLPGVILFLAYLGEIDRADRYTELARSAMKTLQHQLAQSRSSISQIGGFSGWGGIIYTLTHLGILWDEPQLIAEAEAIVALLPPQIEQDTQLDIVRGSAGCIGSLLALYRYVPTAQILDAAMLCGDRLLALATPMARGIGWRIEGLANKPLTGFSHGAAGIAWALLKLAAITGKQRFRKAALGAIAYERSLFSVEAMNWPDLREFAATIRSGKQDRSNCVTAWCHGAPGIGLGRLQCLADLHDSQMRDEIDVALKTTIEQGFGHNHSLCHGDLGNLELLLQASEILGEPQWQVHCDRLAATILGSIDRDGWLCGIPLAVESPGLMTGLAGIGYGLLRLAAPDRVPSVLVLAPPIDRSKTAKTEPLVNIFR
ncbi:type 2 lanthipeptide synthetase LanM family protein [Chamaesiphon minutus]|uniref:Type 2 lantibiotic biosynthesis protein LanM n=1 Tax=Chamaesiphon minutus (strain ATCC 27169 / PCC 6605) TaxID=1173020 RepID=K9UFX8_CHAP6|nr:type 2 lanthipeptide synthetase LanM family protein [Chamaesiphon minutus]AFY93301.1 type 2 lantibiotic biosynthesis protein LanM [Chamaesiphon minutus PCC 6605]